MFIFHKFFESNAFPFASAQILVPTQDSSCGKLQNMTTNLINFFCLRTHPLTQTIKPFTQCNCIANGCEKCIVINQSRPTNQPCGHSMNNMYGTEYSLWLYYYWLCECVDLFQMKVNQISLHRCLQFPHDKFVLMLEVSNSISRV